MYNIKQINKNSAHVTLLFVKDECNSVAANVPVNLTLQPSEAVWIKPLKDPGHDKSIDTLMLQDTLTY